METSYNQCGPVSYGPAPYCSVKRVVPNVTGADALEAARKVYDSGGDICASSLADIRAKTLILHGEKVGDYDGL